MSDQSPAVPAWRCIHGARIATVVPRITVIIPFHDPRGHPENLAGWTREQTADPEAYEVVVVTDGSQEASTLEELRKILRPADRILRAAGHGTFALYAAGAEAARGEILFFTEDHCLADAGCLAAVLQQMDATDDAAATVRWGHVNHTRVARMEELVNHRDAAQWFQPGHWNKVRIRGFAVRKPAYVDAGGFAWQYAGFSEAVLAARLHHRGHRVGYIAASGIRHINTETFAELYKNAWHYSWAECDYCAADDPAFCERYFSASTVLLRHTQISPTRARTLAACLLKVLWRDRALGGKEGPCSRVGGLAAAAHLATQGYLRRLAPWVARLAVASARLRFYLWWWNEPRQLQAFSDYWARVSQLARVEYVAKHPVPLADPAPADAADSASVLRCGALGCHGLESYEGRVFRWTTPVALLHVNFQAADGWVTIDTGRLRGSARHFPLGFFWNGHLIPREKVSTQEGVVQFRIKRAWCNEHGIQELVVAAAPAVRCAGEQRWLGLPLCSLSVTHERPARARIASGGPRKPSPAPSPALRLLLINTADRGGGAETVASALLTGSQRYGNASRLLVAAKRSTSPDVTVLHGSAPPSGLTRSLLRGLRRRAGIEELEFPATRKLLDEGFRDADLVHCHNLHGEYFDLRVLAPLSRLVPVCVTLHDSWIFTGHCAVPGGCGRWEVGCGACPDLARPPAIRWDASAGNWRRKAAALRDARLHIAAPSRWLLERAQRSLLAPAMADARVIPNGVCLETFRPGDREAARSQLGVPVEAFLCTFSAFTGAANPNKDFAALREAVVRLGRMSSRKPVWLVVLGGEAPDEVYEGALIRHLPMQDSKRVATWFQASDAYLHAAPEETFGLAVVEAMACGTPVIAAAGGGVAEVMRDGVDGFLLPVGDAAGICAAAVKVQGAGIGRQMGENASLHARAHYSIDAMLKSYACWYAEVREAHAASVVSRGGLKAVSRAGSDEMRGEVVATTP